jgi:rhomboid-related protein 1/2/3
MRQADVNGDGKIEWSDFYDAIVYSTNRQGESTRAFRKFVEFVAQHGTGRLDKKADKGAIKCWPPPLFMILVTITEIAVYAYYASKGDCEDLSECPPSFGTPMAFRMCCRHQAWRFFSYAMLHASVTHITFNCLIQCLLGIPMEMMNGSWNMCLLYMVGIVSGSLGSSVFDPQANVVGASAAVYTIIGAWTAELLQNWDTMQYKWPRMLGTVILTSLDLGFQVTKYYKAKANDETESVSFAGHFVGYVAGVTFGCYILKNIEPRTGELYIRWGSVAVFMAGLMFAVFWNIFYTFDPHGWCESEATAKCDGDYAGSSN